MHVLTVNGIPDSLYTRLKQRAALHRHSLNREIIVCLEQATYLPAIDAKALLAEVDQLRNRLALSPLTERRLRWAKAIGRP